MRGVSPNPELIRAVLILLFLAITLILRASKASRSSRTAERVGASKRPPLGSALREAMLQSAEQARAQQSGQVEEGLPKFSEPFQQPPAIKPESSFVPSLLLLALVVCLCMIAYRYWAG